MDEKSEAQRGRGIFPDAHSYSEALEEAMN
jgi:hypothetical protein